MAVDRQRLKVRALSDVRSSVLFGLAIFLPVLTWAFANGDRLLGAPADNTELARAALRMLVLVLALAVPACLPWFASGAGWAAALLGPLTVMLVPLPLLSVLCLTGDADPLVFLRPLAGLALAVTALAALTRGLAPAVRNPAALTLVHAGITVVAAGAAWALRGAWLPWLGL